MPNGQSELSIIIRAFTEGFPAAQAEILALAGSAGSVITSYQKLAAASQKLGIDTDKVAKNMAETTVSLFGVDASSKLAAEATADLTKIFQGLTEPIGMGAKEAEKLREVLETLQTEELTAAQGAAVLSKAISKGTTIMVQSAKASTAAQKAQVKVTLANEKATGRLVIQFFKMATGFKRMGGTASDAAKRFVEVATSSKFVAAGTEVSREAMEEMQVALVALLKSGGSLTDMSVEMRKGLEALGFDMQRVAELERAMAQETTLATAAARAARAGVLGLTVAIKGLMSALGRIIIFWGLASMILGPVFELSEKMTEVFSKQSDILDVQRERWLRLASSMQEYLAVMKALRVLQQQQPGVMERGAAAILQWGRALAEAQRQEAEFADIFWSLIVPMGEQLRLLGEAFGIIKEKGAEALDVETRMVEEFGILYDLTSDATEATGELSEHFFDVAVDGRDVINMLVTAGIVSRDTADAFLLVAENLRKLDRAMIISKARKVLEADMDAVDEWEDAQLTALDAVYDRNKAFSDAYAEWQEGRAKLDAEIGGRRLEIAQRFTRARFDLEQELSDKLEDIWTNFNRSIVDLEIERGLKRDDIILDLNRAMADLDVRVTDKRTDIWTKFWRGIEDLDIDTAQKREDIEIDRERRLADLQDKFHKEQRRNERRYLFDLIELAIDRDAVAIRQLQRRYAFETKERVIALREEREEEDTRYEQALEDLGLYYDRRAAEIVRRRSREFTDLKIWERRQARVIRLRQDRAFMDLREWERRKAKEIEKNRDRDLDDLDTHERRKREELRIAEGRAFADLVTWAGQARQELWRSWKARERDAVSHYRQTLIDAGLWHGSLTRAEQRYQDDKTTILKEAIRERAKLEKAFLEWLQFIYTFPSLATPMGFEQWLSGALPGFQQGPPAGAWQYPGSPGGGTLLQSPAFGTTQVQESRVNVDVNVRGDGVSPVFQRELIDAITREVVVAARYKSRYR